MISKKEIKIAASMACADFWRLEEQVKTLEKAKVDILHCDIMDGNFVPNFSLFPDFVTIETTEDFFTILMYLSNGNFESPGSYDQGCISDVVRSCKLLKNAIRVCQDAPALTPQRVTAIKRINETTEGFKRFMG
jgi:hypothetical protein